MATTSAHLRNLIADKQIIITPYDPSCAVNGTYILHLGSSLWSYDSEYDDNLALNPENKYTDGDKTLTKYGYYLEPGRTYWAVLKERVSSENYDIEIVGYEGFAKYGLNVNEYQFNGSEVRIAVTVNRALKVTEGDTIAKIKFGETDSSTMAVPIGGIIGWAGGPIPYGYCVCDGSNGSPNLINRFIRGARTNRPVNMVLVKDAGSDIYDLIFIMRYK